MLVNLSLISEYFTSILLHVDQFFILRFEVETSFAENMERVIVYVAVLVLVCSLFTLLMSNNQKRKKQVNFIEKNLENAKLKSDIDNFQSIDTQNSTVADRQEIMEERGVEVESYSQDNVIDSVRNPNIFELDNGFVINKRNIKENKVTEGENILSTNEEEEYDKNNISEFLSINNPKAKTDLTEELSEIEVEMLDVRQKYKSGKISSADYLSKTQALYKRGEDLVEKQISIGG